MKTFSHGNTLRQLRRSKWIIWIQLYCLLGWTLLSPTLNAVYVQDVNAPGFALNQPSSYSPTWDGNGVGDPEPPEGADMSDNDTDGLPAWFEDWYGAVHGATVNMRGNPDSDNDGATDGNELHVMGTDPLNATSNGSGAPDGLWWQLTHTDTDEDGLMNWMEANGSGFGGQYGTDMNSSDTDGDGMDDGFEVNTTGTSPTNADTDGNGLNDLEDYLFATDPSGDYDADGLTNAQEAQQTYQAENWNWLRSSMRQADTDGDGLNDGYEVSNYRNGEYKSSSNPLLFSTDRNGVPDRQVMNYLFPSDRYGINSPGALPNAAAGTTYTSPAFTVANAQGATTWAVTAGNLPATLAFNGNYLEGYAPPGSYSFTVQVTDAANRSATADYTLAVDLLPLNITSAALVPDVLFGAPVSHSFTAAGGYGGFSWSTTGWGWLPSGLYLSTDGLLSGAATYPGNYTFPVRVADMNGASAEQWVSLNVTLPALVITSLALSTGVQVNSGLSASFTAVGGTGSYSWSVPNGSLPGGMSLSSDGQLMGSPYSAGSYSFTVRVTDGSGNYAEQGAYVYVSEVPPPPTPEPPQITSSPYLPSGQDGRAYSYDFSASGGSGAYTWTSWWGLPSGLSLSSSGQLAGTVSGSGSYSFTVQVTDGGGNSSQKTFYLYVENAPPAAPPQIQGPLSLTASPWTPQSWTLTASGGSGGSYAWSLWNSQLPSGFSLSSDGTLTGNFEGQTGSFSFYVQAYDGSSSSGEWFTVDVTDRDADGDGMLASVEHELALGLGLPLHDGSRNSVQPELDDWYVYYHARLAATDGPDEDGDGLGPLLEQVLGTNPALKDSDGDFRPDWWVFYQAYGRFFDTTDADGDGLYAVLEGRMGTSDEQEDSDGDGLTDAYEWQYLSYADPADDDSDNDGLNDGAELTAGTQARNPDSDDDYLTDNEEVNNLYALPLPTSPLDPDSDDDGIPDHGEVSLTDSDGGGIPDRLEEHWNMNIHDARDEADDYDGDGHSNYTAYLGGWDIHAQFVPQFDTDADGMTNLYELAKGFDPADQKDGADDPDGDFLTNAEEFLAQTSPVHLLTPGYQGETVTDRDDSTGVGVFDENGALVVRAVLNDYEVASDQELFLNTTPPLTRGNGPLEATREYDDDWDQDGLSNFDELYPLYGSPTDPRVWQPPLAITTTILADGQKGAPYTAVLAHVGGQPGFTYSLASGSLPAGLGLNTTAEPGVWAISGTPTAEGSHTFTLLVTDAYERTDTQDLTLVVGPEILPPPPLEITTTSLPLGEVGVAYSTTLNASGGTGSYTFSVSGALPAGLGLDASVGAISGTPTAAGSHTFTLVVADAGQRTDTQELTLVVGQPLTVAFSGSGTVGEALTSTISATGGIPPYAYSIDGLPPGLSVIGSQITGTPTSAGSYAVTATVVDSSQPPVTATQTSTFTVEPSTPNPTLTLATTNAQLAGVLGQAYSVALSATGAVDPVSYALSGALPAGLSFDSATGTISGTPTAETLAGQAVTITVSSGGDSQDFGRSIDISQPVVFTTDAALPGAEKDSVYFQGLIAQGGRGTLVFTKTAGTLPPGLTLSGTGYLTGKVGAVGTYMFTVKAVDALGRSGSKEFTLAVSMPPPPLSFVTGALPPAGVGLPYSFQFQVSSPGAVFSTSSLPPGFQLSSDGTLTGGSGEAGSWQFDVTAKVSAGTGNGISRAAATFTLSVAAPELSFSGSRFVATGTQMELRFGVSAGGQAVPGMQVQVGGQQATTDVNGQATVSLAAPQEQGVFMVQVGFAGGSQTYEFYAHPPAGAQATVPEPSPGPPPTPRVVSMEDDETIVQSRWISVSRGTLDAHYGGIGSGWAVGYVGGQWRIVHVEADGSYMRHETKWKSSDGQEGEGEPPAMKDLQWKDGLAEGVDQKFPDTEMGNLDLSSEVIPDGTYWNTPWPDWATGSDVYRINHSWWGKSKDRSHHVTAEVRVLKKTAVGGGVASSGNEAGWKKAFLEVTSERNPNGTNSIKGTQSVALLASANPTQTHTLGPVAEGYNAAVANLLPVEVIQHPADVTSGSSEPPTTQSLRLCRWLDAYDSSGNLATDYPRYDRDRIRIKIPAAPFPGQNKITVKIATKKPAGTNDPEDAANDLECDKIGDSFISKPIILVGDGFRAGNGGDDAWSQVSPRDEQTNDPTHVASPGGKVEIELPLPANPKIEFPIAKYTSKVKVQSYVVRSPSSNTRISANILTYLSDGIQRTKDIYKQAHIKIEHQGPYDCVLTDAELDLINSDQGDGARTLLLEGGNANYLEDGESQFVFDKIRELDGGGTDFVRIIYMDCDFVGRNQNVAGQTIRDLITNENKYGVYEGFIVIPIKNASDITLPPHESGHALKMLHPKDEAVLDGENPALTLELPYMLMSRTSTSMWDASLSKWMVFEYSAKRFVKKDLAKLSTSPRPLFILPFP